MADPICRWRNMTPKTVCEFVAKLPKEKMRKEDFRKYMESKWSGFFHTPYQSACQLGLYYESTDNYYYPRFKNNITENEATQYLEHWMHRYYVPNPYTKQGFKKMAEPIFLLSSIVEYLEKNHNSVDIDSLVIELFKEEIGNKDIFINALNNHSKVIEIKDGIVTLLPNYKEKMDMHLTRDNKKQFFENFDVKNYSYKHNLQMIFYGAPGTGKSTKVKLITKDKSKTVITFHPDTDYASFVGAYKPTMNGTDIKYEFVPQAFAKAYVKAWKDISQPHYLVIEEINRGNCAQIFGDIFQLLDRDRIGYSDYIIDVDKDFADYLEYELGNNQIYKDKIKELCNHDESFSFSKIALPENLYILATMNTSDQSLFPMDSAFKRRWEWEYIPINIEDAKKLHITIGNKKYNWGDFLEKINPKIKELTGSEDKQLGNRFVKVVDDNISLEQFRSKVLFYLWFEIFREEAGSHKTIFRKKSNDVDEEICFSDLFSENADQMIQELMNYNEINTEE